MLEACHASWKTRGKTILSDISLAVRKGEFLGLMGPNGSGKSTLLSLLGGLSPPSGGAILLDGAPLATMRRKMIARHIAFVEQHTETPEQISARQVAELGRIPHLSALRPWSTKDTAITDAALGKAGMLDLADRPWRTLSGGEKQRLHFARALAQQADILLLDEPTNHLDIHHQFSLLDLVRRERLTVIAALHDLNHAAMFCDRIALINHGRLAAIGKPQHILTSALIQDIFHIESVVEKSLSGPLHIRYIRPAQVVHHHGNRKIL